MARQHAGVRVLEDFTAACGQCLLPWRKCPVQREEEFKKTRGQVASGCEVLWRAIHQRFVVDHVLFFKSGLSGMPVTVGVPHGRVRVNELARVPALRPTRNASGYRRRGPA